MKQYTGKLTASAEPMTRGAYNSARGWTLPADEDGNDTGYRVTNTDTLHVSWLPTAVFDRVYTEVE